MSQSSYTSHGHPIPGIHKCGDPPAKAVARCGGPNMCTTCSNDVIRAYGDLGAGVVGDPHMTVGTITAASKQSLVDPVRLQALEMAIRKSRYNSGADSIVSAAKEFEKFLRGEG